MMAPLWLLLLVLVVPAEAVSAGVGAGGGDTDTAGEGEAAGEGEGAGVQSPHFHRQLSQICPPYSSPLCATIECVLFSCCSSSWGAFSCRNQSRRQTPACN